MGKIKETINNAVVYIYNSNDMYDVPDESVNLIITSPPYWTLKDYDLKSLSESQGKSIFFLDKY